MKKILCSILAMTMLLASVMLVPSTASAEGETLVLPYTSAMNAVVDNKDTCTATKNFEVDGKKAVLVIPNPKSEKGGSILLDSWDLATKGFDLDKFGYMVVSYKYVTDTPAYTGPMKVNFLTRGGVLTKPVSMTSNENIVANTWATATFNFKDPIQSALNTEMSEHILGQMHLSPLGTASVYDMKDTDMIYIESLTLYADNPNPNGTYGVSFVKGDSMAKGDDLPQMSKATGETITLPECPYTLDGFNFTGWKWSTDSVIYKAGDTVVAPEAPSTFSAVWTRIGEAAVTGATLTLTYSNILNAIVGNRDTAVYTKNVDVDDRKAVLLVPNPISTAGSITLDSWDLATKGFDLDKFGYMVVSYKYMSDSPAYNGPMKINFLTGGAALTKTVNLTSNENVVAGDWAKATFCFKDAVKSYLNPGNATHILRQMHFYPFGTTNVDTMKDSDMLYIESVTLYSDNPDPDFQFTITFEKGDIKATGEQIEPLKYAAQQVITVPECSYNLEGATFGGWRWNMDDKVYKPGETITNPAAHSSFTAVWELEKVIADSIVLQYPAYYMGNINKHTYLISGNDIIDGVKVIKAVPNPDNEKESVMGIDCWDYKKANVDLDIYKYMQVTYKYVSPNPKADLHMAYNFMTSGIFEKAHKAYSVEPLEANTWAVANFDISEMANLGKEGVEHVFKQAHMYPFGDATNKQLTKDDVIYISQLEFFKENPGSEVHKSYVTGYTDGTFKPNKTLSRAEACTIVARLIASETDIASATKSAFTDVTADKWYFGNIAFLESKGLLASYSGAFLPDQPITRAEFAELAFNMGLAKENPDNKKSFTDVTEAHPKYKAIMAAASAGLINGYDDGTFLPDRAVTRAQVVTIVNRARNRFVNKDSLSSKLPNIFTDVNASHWAYYDIVEAAVGHTSKMAEDGKEKWQGIHSLDITNFSESEAFIYQLDKKVEQRIAEIRDTKDSITVKGIKYYVSADGSDENDGLSPETAWKTIAKVNSATLTGNDAVLFRRGDTFRGAVISRAGATYAAYGEGAKPILTPSPENSAYKEAWIATDVPNVYKYHNKVDNNVGAIVYNGGGKGMENVARMVLLNKPAEDGSVTDRTSGKVYTGLESLENNYFIHEVDTHEIYWRVDEGNPGEIYKSIEMNPAQHGLRVNSLGATIDNLCFMYAGNHGVSGPSCKNLIVTNCEFGYIGGSKQGSFESTGRYGNAVEIYGSCDNYQIKNCYVYQVYDAGITHQISAGTGNCLMKDVLYENNIIEYCTYNIEYFLSASPNETDERRMENIVMRGNILRNAGFGWGYQRPDRSSDASVKGWSSYNRADGFVFENNIIDRARCVLLHIGADYAQWLPTFKNNTYVQYYPSKFIQFGQNPVKEYPFNGTVTDVLESVVNEENYTVHFVKQK